ncbi:MAG: response regulator [Polyangiales bacterium]
MAHRILVFESDPHFTAELRRGFATRAVEIDIVADGNKGLERASAAKPDLILLSIELQGMNGFLVCKKIKKDPELASVPLLILSSDPNADEIFEQHQKLRTRADDYVKKPVPFEELLTRARQFVPIEEAAEPDSTQVLSRQNVDDEIDAFADDAFDALMVSDAVAEPEIVADFEDEEDHTAVERGDFEAVARVPGAPCRSVRPAPSRLLPSRPLRPRPPPPPSTPPPPPVARRPYGPAVVAMDDAALDAAHARIAELEAKLSDAESRASRVESLERESSTFQSKVADLEKEVVTLKTKGASGGGGISSREFLDLREKLNSKDKEILNLRDQVTSRDKELLDLRDRNPWSSAKADDVEDDKLAIERQLATAQEQLEATLQDKEAATKRGDDLKGRLDRAEEKGKKLEGEPRSDEAAAAAKQAELEEAKAEAVASLRAENAAASAAKDEAHAAVSTARNEHAAALEALKSEHDATLRPRAASTETPWTRSRTNTRRRPHRAPGSARRGARIVARGARDGERDRERDACGGARGASRRARSGPRPKRCSRTNELEAAKAAAPRRGFAKSLEGAKASWRWRMRTPSTRARAPRSQARGHRRQVADGDRVARRDRSGQGVGQPRSRSWKANTPTSKGRACHAWQRGLDAANAHLEPQGDVSVAHRSSGFARSDEGRPRRSGLRRGLAKDIATDDALSQRVRRAMSIGLGLLEDQKNNTFEGSAE